MVFCLLRTSHVRIVAWEIIIDPLMLVNSVPRTLTFCYTSHMHIHTAPYHRELRKRRKSVKLPFGAQRFLAILEGVEGGFAIGAGLVAGLSFTTVNRKVLLTTAIISLLVSGFNSAAVKYSSEHYADELDGREKHNHIKHYLVPAAYEFGAYALISFLTLLPLLFFTNIKHAAIWYTIFS